MFRNGFGAIQAEGEDAQLLDDPFTMHVWEHDEHGLLIRTKSEAVKVLDLLSSFDPLQMMVTFGKHKKKAGFSCCQLKWPRAPAASILIALEDAYAVLGLTQLNGKSWRWINNGFSVWLTMMQGIGYCSHLLPSSATRQASLHRW